MKTCAACGKEVEESALFMSANGEVCADCNLDDEIASKGMMIAPLTIVALVGAIVPFFFSFSSASTVTTNGQTTTSYVDYVALGGGGIAIAVGLAAIVTALKSGGAKTQNLAAAAAAVVVGVIQLLRGFGTM